ncbi:MAG: nuclear transport factor 2 family protein [Gemmataceae bacterium]|nr:nuclear transport factor 2 family protein [Gemmataceae bacterium]
MPCPRLLLSAVAAALLAWHCLAADRPTTAADDAKLAVQRILDDQARAWNQGDLEAFMAGYWKSPDLSFFSGANKTTGWQATLDRYRKNYQGKGKEMGRLAFKEVATDPLGADHALVRGRFELTLSTGRVTGLFTLIVRKFPEGWRIIHDHTSN